MTTDTTAHPRSGRAVPRPTADDVQGWIVRGYNLGHVLHVVGTVHDPIPVRLFLRRATDGDADAPQIQSAAHWGDDKPSAVLNVGFTWTGLRALGVPAPTLAGFPTDFRVGAVDRATKIGDIAGSAPAHWDEGMADTDLVHVIWTVHGTSADAVDACWDRVRSAIGDAMTVVQTYKGSALPDGKVHFGYRDSISQPRIDGFLNDNQIPDAQPASPAGAFFLGHESQFENVTFDLPLPSALGGNGTYNAFRVLEQDVFGFEAFLIEAAAVVGADPRVGEAGVDDPAEWIAAKVCGRWRNGNALERHPIHEGTFDGPDERNDYSYHDPFGTTCPLGSHMRRANPRNTPIVQRASNHTRRITRRGMPYGPAIEPGTTTPDGKRRGLLGNFLCASLTAQFEGVQYDWINLGLQHPDISGTNDVMLGANDSATSRFSIPMPGGDPIELHGFPRFVQTRASVYTFLPSLTGLRWLAG
ncbi:MAG: hypothetical protein AAGD35_07905 [Actinomycetota bacterium]